MSAAAIIIVLVVVSVILGVYFSKKACPKFGYKCPAPVVTPPAAAVTPPAAADTPPSPPLVETAKTENKRGPAVQPPVDTAKPMEAARETAAQLASRQAEDQAIAARKAEQEAQARQQAEQRARQQAEQQARDRAEQQALADQRARDQAEREARERQLAEQEAQAARARQQAEQQARQQAEQQAQKQILQDTEYIATSPKAVNFTAPSEPVAYTMSFSVKIDSQAGGWREIWRRGASGEGNLSRVPAFFIAGSDAGAGRVHYVHGSTTDWNTHTFSSNFRATPGVWFHFAATVDQATNKITAYVNGVLEPNENPANATTTGTFKWGNTQDFFNIAQNGGVHIMNWVFTPRVLSATDIAGLARAPVPAAPEGYARGGITSQSFGGGGGGDYAMNCPSGMMKNISGRGGWWVDQLKGNCTDGTTLNPVGGQGGGPVDTADCPSGYTGVDVTYGEFVGKVTPKCGGAPTTPIGGGLGSGGGQSGSFDCPGAGKITGISGKAGSYIDSMKVTCSG